MRRAPNLVSAARAAVIKAEIGHRSQPAPQVVAARYASAAQIIAQASIAGSLIAQMQECIPAEYFNL